MSDTDFDDFDDLDTPIKLLAMQIINSLLVL